VASNSGEPCLAPVTSSAQQPKQPGRVSDEDAVDVCTGRHDAPLGADEAEDRDDRYRLGPGPRAPFVDDAANQRRLASTARQ